MKQEYEISVIVKIDEDNPKNSEILITTPDEQPKLSARSIATILAGATMVIIRGCKKGNNRDNMEDHEMFQYVLDYMNNEFVSAELKAQLGEHHNK